MRRIVGCIAGVMLLGLGGALLWFSGLGNDSFSALDRSVFNLQSLLSYGAVCTVLNVLFFIFQIVFARRLIGVGTIVAWVGIGYSCELFYTLLCMLPAPQNIAVRLLFVAGAVLSVGFGSSLYQTSDIGVSPYDSLSITLAYKTPVPYFWARMITDAACVIAILLLGQYRTIGVATIIVTFTMGPVAHFCNDHVSCRLLRHHHPSEH